MKKLLAIVILSMFAGSSFAQMKRERVSADGPVDAVFKAQRLITLSTTKNVNPGTIQFMIQHSFGPIESLTNSQELWGIDGAANIRFSLDWGISENLSLGFGRTKYEKAYDFRGKYTLAKQTRSGSVPLGVAIDATLGIRTDDAPGYSFNDRLFGGVSIPVSRKVNEEFSMLISPSIAFFQKTDFISPFYSFKDIYYGVGLGARYKVSKRMVLMGEFSPVYSDGLRTNFGMGLEMETGSHVFQLFVTTSQFYTEPYMMRYATNLDGGVLEHLRIGFNVNRLFWYD
ncbi:hypothetical protein EP331_05835 [bacterium]|nr:MAG: hypothetical protein EP331_05835 [bacterium]